MKNLVKYRDQFNFFTPRCYAIQYKYKLENDDYITITHLENKRIIKIKDTNFFDDI